MDKRSGAAGGKNQRANAQVSDTWESALTSFVEASTDAFLLFDAELDLVGANPAAERLFRLSKKGEATYVGTNVVDLLPNARANGEHEKYRHVLVTGEPFAADCVLRTRGGRQIHLSIRAFRVGTGLGITASDITGRKQADQALRESENKYRELADLLPEIVFEVDEKGILTLVNRNAFESTGYSQEDFEHGLSVLQVMAPEDRDRAEENLKKVFGGQTTGGNEYTMTKKDGSTVPVIVFSNPVTKGRKPAGARGIVIDISQRKAMEDALKESEENFRALAENSLDCISVLSGEGFHVYANRRMAETTGYSVGEILQKTFRELVDPAELETVEDNFKRRLRGEPVPSPYEVLMIRRDGRSMLADLAAARTTWHGQPAVMAVYRDITDRKHEENALREVTEKFKDLAELLPQVVFEAGTSGKFTFVNQKGFELSGYRQEDIEAGLSVLEVMVPEDRDRARDNIRRLLKGEKPGGNEYTMLRKDGSTFPAVVYSSPIRRNGRAVGFRGIGVDVTDRKKAEQALKESEERFRAVVENASDVIIIIGADGAILYESPAVERMLGYVPEEVIGQNSLSFVHTDDLPRVVEQFGEMMRKPGSPIQSAVSVRHKDGSWRIADAIGQNLLDDPAVGGIVVNFRDITENKRAQEALRHSEEHFRSLIEKALDVIVIIDVNGKIRYESPSIERVLGFKPEELIGQDGLAWPHPDDMPAVMEVFQRILDTPNASGSIELRVRHKDGSWRDAEAIGRNLLHDPAVQGIVVNFRDVTERKKAEEAVRRSETKYRLLAEKMNDIVWILDLDLRTTYVSPSVEKVLGFTPEERVAQDPREQMTPASFAQAQSLRAAELERERKGHASPDRSAKVELEYYRKDGSTVWMESIVSGIRDDSGKLVGFHGLSRDITERREAEKKLAESEQRFRAIVEAMPTAIAISRKRDGAIIYANKHFGPAVGAPSSAANSLKTFDLYQDPRDREAVLNRIQKGEPLRNFEYLGRKADGSTFWVMASIEPLEFQGEEALLGAFYDITERKQMEDKLRELYEAEKRAREQLEVEMNRRVEFTRALAHELKTPLTSVLASSDLLASELKDEPVLSLARNISRGASNLNSTIDELLDLARGEVGMLQLKLESADISQLLRETADAMAPLASKRSQSLVVEVPPSLPAVQADVARLQQVVTNLLSNAVKFTPVRGTITLRAKVRNADVVVEVQDTGRGISKEEQKHLFEPYHRLRRDEKGPSGLGLGLSLSKTLIELHGGEIWAKSRSGQGATFGFSLPLEVPAQRGSTSEQADKLWKVLVIEDDQEIVDSLSLLFQMRWPEAQLVSTVLGEEGVELAESESPDLVIIDLGLPDISGFEVLRQIRAFSSVPTVILTVRADEGDMVKGLEWGADDYVIKPFRQSEFLARLKVQLRKQAGPEQGAPIVCGPLRLDPSTFQLTYSGREINLTIIEGNITRCLMENAGHVVTHTRLAEAVWGEDYPGALDSLRVYIRYLRQKLERDPSNPKLILTKPGVGYSLVKPV